MNKMGGGSRFTPSKQVRKSTSGGCSASSSVGETRNCTIPYCSRGRKCVILISRPSANPNRPFFCCPILKEEDNCNYFLWCDEAPGIFRGDAAGNDDELWKVELMGRVDAMMREQKLNAEVMTKLMANIDAIMIEQSQQANLLVKLIGKIDATITEQKQKKLCLLVMCSIMILFIALSIGRLTV